MSTYNKVTEDAAQGNLAAQEILAKAPEIAKLAIAVSQRRRCPAPKENKP